MPPPATRALPNRWLTARATTLLVLAAAGAARAQPPDLVTDRPDQTESAAVVPAGWIQIETGATMARDESAGVEVEVLEIPGTLVRLGLTERIELRLGWAGYTEVEVAAAGGTTRGDGLLDAALGAKIRLAPERGRRPQTALLLSASMPIGDPAFTSDRVDPGFRLAAAHTLSDRVGLGYNLGVEWSTGFGEAGDRSTTSDVFYSLVAGFALDPRWSTFAELFGRLEASSEAGSRHSFDTGLTYRVNADLQLDLAGGVGLSDAADDWFVGVGLSVRTNRRSP